MSLTLCCGGGGYIVIKDVEFEFFTVQFFKLICFPFNAERLEILTYFILKLRKLKIIATRTVPLAVKFHSLKALTRAFSSRLFQGEYETVRGTIEWPKATSRGAKRRSGKGSGERVSRGPDWGCHTGKF